MRASIIRIIQNEAKRIRNPATAEPRVLLPCFCLSGLPALRIMLRPPAMMKKKRIIPAITKIFFTIRVTKTAGVEKVESTDFPSFIQKASSI